jgi:hypothetical protein
MSCGRVESTGTYGAGLLRHLCRDEVLEVTSPDKQDRRRRGRTTTWTLRMQRTPHLPASAPLPQNARWDDESSESHIAARRPSRRARWPCSHQNTSIICASDELRVAAAKYAHATDQDAGRLALDRTIAGRIYCLLTASSLGRRYL